MLKLRISGFKSIDKAELELRNLTLLIGPPDSGKSNTLEALGLLSFLAYGGAPVDYFRVWSIDAVRNLLLPDAEAEVQLFDVNESRLCKACVSRQPNAIRVNASTPETSATLDFMFSGGLSISGDALRAALNLMRIRFYRFFASSFQRNTTPYHYYPSYSPLNNLKNSNPELYKMLWENVPIPPRSPNLIDILKHNSEFYEITSSLLKNLSGYERVVPVRIPVNGAVIDTLAVEAVAEGLPIPVLIPINLVAEGILDYLATLLAVKAALPNQIPRYLPDIVVLEEPEAHIFPYLVKELAEEIALQTGASDKYVVLSTHNPVTLITLLEKAPLDKIAIYYVHRDRLTLMTKYYRLSKEDIESLLDMGFNAHLVLEDMLKEKVNK